MKVIKYYLIIFILGAGLVHLNAQGQASPIISSAPGNASTPGQLSKKPPPTDVYKRENIIPEKKPVPYSYLREADVMWAKDVWRVIDLRQRMNYPLRYPQEDAIEDENRYSLYLLLMKAIAAEEISAYDFGDRWSNPFEIPTTINQIYEDIDADVQYTSLDSTEIYFADLRGSYVNKIYIKEKWYFDKKHSEMRVRIVAIVPQLDIMNINGVIERTTPFAVYFPECRRLFATHPVFSPGNDAQRISFDDLFMQRRFASTISGESSIHDNRQIVDFMSGQDALMEAERIKGEIFIMEHDLWEY